MNIISQEENPGCERYMSRGITLIKPKLCDALRPQRSFDQLNPWEELGASDVEITALRTELRAKVISI